MEFALPHWSILVLIMVGTGIFSGVTAALWATEKTFKENWLRYALIGVVASLTVPLFLSTIRSDLIRTTTGGFAQENYFVFAGLCALAAFYAPSYLKRLSDRILQQLDATKKQAEIAERTADAARRETTATREMVQRNQKIVEALEVGASEPAERNSVEPAERDVE